MLVGDAFNMRHPLTGGGMTVAFNDAVLLGKLLGVAPDLPALDDWDAVRGRLHTWYWKRKPLASTVNILSVALYDLFGAEDENLAILRDGCFKYFLLGGACVRDPVALLSGLAPDPALLFYHFFAVAFYSIYCMFAHERSYPARPGAHTSDDDEDEIKAKYVTRRPEFSEYPWLAVKSVHVLWVAAVVFMPLLWKEIR